MTDLVAGKYKLPWEEDIMHKDGTSCGFAPPTRTYKGAEANPVVTGAAANGHANGTTNGKKRSRE